MISQKTEMQLQNRVNVFMVGYRTYINLQMVFVSINSPDTNRILGS